MFTVTKTTKIKLDGKTYLLEAGDKIGVNDEVAKYVVDNKPEEMVKGGMGEARQSGEFDIDQVMKGIEVEFEHVGWPTEDDNKEEIIRKVFSALEITMDHLANIPNYYDYLKDMETRAEENGDIDEEESSTEMKSQEILKKLKEELIEATNLLTEAAVKRRYLKVIGKDNERYFSPSSAYDNYMVHFINKLFEDRRFKDGNYKVSVVTAVPPGFRKMSLETFLKELIP